MGRAQRANRAAPRGYERVLCPDIEGCPTSAFVHGRLKILVSQEPHGLHLSISHPERYPTWDEIRDARYALLPVDRSFAMILPPPGEYVNVHENCFHLWEFAEKREPAEVAP